MYFELPKQVAFYDAENESWIGGIAFKDSLICLCCGAVVNINDFLEEMAEDYSEIKNPIIPMEWVDISEECLGDAEFDYNSGKMKV